MAGCYRHLETGDLRSDVWEIIRHVHGVNNTDSKNRYDFMQKPENMFSSRNTRVGLQLMGLTQRVKEMGTHIKSVHSDAMLANEVMQKGERWQFDRFFLVRMFMVASA